MKNKKLLGLLIGLVCLSFCVTLVLSACQNDGDDYEDPKPTVGEETSPTAGKPTIPEETQPQQTQPEETVPAETEPAETVPEETQPEPTEGSSGSSGSNLNTGTGGGYNPGSGDSTEPEDPTEPPQIVVPEPGSENNAYAEYVNDATGSFTTVSVPAGKAIYYRLKTPGSFLRVEDTDAVIKMGETTYQAQDGILEIPLPADGSQVISFAVVNQNSEDKAFAVEIRDALGSKDNPIEIQSVAELQATVQEGDTDGIFYRWIADQSGVLKFALQSQNNKADAIVAVKGESVQLSQGSGQIPVSEGDPVLIQVLTGENEDGIRPAAQIQLRGYISQIVELTVSEIPSEIESVTVPAEQSVIYRITGVKGKALTLKDADFRVFCGEQLYSPDENGVIFVNLPNSGKVVELELINSSAEAKAVQMMFGQPSGHKLNPHKLEMLGELALTARADLGGYYYSYTAPRCGVVSFQIWTAPERENVKTDIVLINNTTGAVAQLWNMGVQNESVSVQVMVGDELTIRVQVVDEIGFETDAELMIYGELYGSEELPIIVMYPGFIATVPAGETLYYGGYNLGGLILSMEGYSVTIAHNGVTYTPDGSKVSFDVVAEGRNPAVFAITNNGFATEQYEVVFTYPVGHAENPDELKLGVNTLTQKAGASDYYYSFTAPRAGTVSVLFDGAAQWVYAMDNVTQGIYGDTQWSDSDPLQTETTVEVKAGDRVVVRVNTYDAANSFENPAGTVEFTVEYISGPTVVTNLQQSTSLILQAGEGGLISGDFYGYSLVIDGAKNVAVAYDGVLYLPDKSGSVMVKFPETGTETIQVTVFNYAASQLTYVVRFASGDVGSAANPEILTLGSHSVSFSEGGEPYYFKYVVEKRGTLIFTFDTDVEGWYLLNNNILRYTVPGQNVYRLGVREGMVVMLSISTYDSSSYGVIPEGTIDFTVEYQ